MRYVLVLLAALMLPPALSAQLQVGISFNLDIQPAWGPVGYDYAEYYYLPDIEVYYNVPRHRFYFYEGGHWIYRSHLPSRYAHYDYYNSYKIVVNDRDPWRHHYTYRDKYSSYKGRHGQAFIRDSHDSKYFVNKHHPQHSKWVGEQKQKGGNNGHYNKTSKDRKQNGSRMRSSGKQGNGKSSNGKHGGGKRKK
ncbi:MAG: hypothetical protein IH600_17550 [Bacteroidetes bacterium]|nr:hypothetical protein [Bacteroidota bacterium]